MPLTCRTWISVSSAKRNQPRALQRNGSSPFGRSGHNRILNILQSIGRCSVTPVRSRFTLVLLRHTATDKLSRNDTAIVLCRQMETRTAHELHTPPFETGTDGVIHEILILETQIQQCQLVRVTLRHVPIAYTRCNRSRSCHA